MSQFYSEHRMAMALKKIDRLDAEVARLSTYSHRNGETEEPQVEGWYWVEMPYHRGGVPIYTVIPWRQELSESEWWAYEGHPVYGPIPQPRLEIPHG
jgi:hypothetical protein